MKEKEEERERDGEEGEGGRGGGRGREREGEREGEGEGEGGREREGGRGGEGEGGRGRERERERERERHIESHRVMCFHTDLSQPCPECGQQVLKPSKEKHSNTEDAGEDESNHHNDRARIHSSYIVLINTRIVNSLHVHLNPLVHVHIL